MYRAGLKDYFDSIWNYSDILGFALLYITTICQLFEELKDDPNLKLACAFNYMLLYLRGMSYLRIFSNLRYLINMVIEIMKDMSSFMILLGYWIFAFHFMFYLFIKKEEGDPLIQFIVALSQTYKLAFGDFSTDDYSPMEWIFFIICSLFIPLVLFNLLIAIMGDTYDRVQTNARVVDLKEQANLVMEVEGLLHWQLNTNEDRKQKYLICYDEALSEEMGDSAAWEGKVKGMTRQLTKIENKVTEILNVKKEILAAVGYEIRSCLGKSK